MYVAVREWCCKLELFVKIVGIILTTSYLLMGLFSVGWYILSHNVVKKDDPALNTVQEVNNFPNLDDSSVDCGRGPDVFELGKSVIVLAVILMSSFLGVVTNLFLVVGVKLEKGFLLLPWLVFHCIIILMCLGGGVYLGLHFAVLGKCQDYAKTAISMFPIVFGIFFIFVWIMVDQLFVRLRNKKHIKDVVAFSRTASLASFRSNDPRHGISNKNLFDNNTLRSNKSVKSLPNGPIRSKSQPRERAYQIKEFSCKLDIPGMKKSRSLDHILDSSGSNSSVGVPTGPNYWTREGGRTLPKKIEHKGKLEHQDIGKHKEKIKLKKKSMHPQKMKKSRSIDEILDSQSSISSGSNDGSYHRRPKHASRDSGRKSVQKEGSGTIPRRTKAKEKKPTDTMRSTRSVASMKSVTIHPEVTEYHYRELSHDRELPQFDDYDPHSYDDNFDDLVDRDYDYDNQYNPKVAVYHYNDVQRQGEQMVEFRDTGYQSDGMLDEYEEYSSSDGSSFNNYDVQSARMVNKPKRVSVIFEEDETKLSEMDMDENKNWSKEETELRVDERIPSPVYPTSTPPLKNSPVYPTATPPLRDSPIYPTATPPLRDPPIYPTDEPPLRDPPIYPTATPPLRNRDWKTLSGRQFTLTKTNSNTLKLPNDYHQENFLPIV